MKLSKKHIKTILLALLLVILNTSTLKASDFNITSTYNIYLNNIEDTFVSVEEDLEIKVNNPDFYIPKDSTQTVTITKNELVRETLQVLDKYGQSKNFSMNEMDEYFEIVINNIVDIKGNNPFFAKIQYKTTEFVNQSGNITNLYLPGLHEDISFEKTDPKHNLKTQNQYFLSYHVPIDAPEHSFIKPKDISFKTDNKFGTYTFPQSARIGNAGWIQIGTEQYYSFKISQTIPQTDFLTPEQLSKYIGWLSKNILELTLPREFEENNQEVFFTKISPKPTRIKSDEEGNVIAVFEKEAIQEEEVIIEGYVKISQNSKGIPTFTLQEYKERIKELNRLDIYTQSDKYWESDSPEIKEIAQKFLNENNNSTILDLIKANYDFVVENLEYDREKSEGNNVRSGALKTLQTGQGVCMEYADLLIAILRAQGIPARAAFGYGNDPLIGDTQNQTGHQWVQVWYPEYGWLSIDPTWGETGREYIGSDLEHLLWYTSGDSNLRVADSIIYSADSAGNSDLSNYKVETTPLHKNKVPNLEELNTISDIVIEYALEDTKISDYEYILKTTMLGRALIFITPTAIILIVLITISMIVSKLFKRRKNQT